MATNNTEPQYPRRGFRHNAVHNEWYEQGVYQTGDATPDREYTGNPDRPGPQKRDTVTGLLVWKVPVHDPGEPNTRRAGYDVYILSDTEPVPTTQEVSPGIRPVVFEGLTVEPRVGGQGEFKFLTQTIRATGYAPAPQPGARGGGAGSGSGSGTSKSAS